MVLNRALIRQFLRFTLVGAAATAIQYVILIIAVERLKADSVAGSCVGFTISAAVNYLLNYHFTFQSESEHKIAAVRFALIAGLGLALNAFIMTLLVHRLHIAYFVSQLIVTVLVLIWNFAGSALWTFASKLPDRAT